MIYATVFIVVVMTFPTYGWQEKMEDHCIQRERRRTFVRWVTSRTSWCCTFDVCVGSELVCCYNRWWWCPCCVGGDVYHRAMVRRVSSGRFFQRGRAGVSKVGLDWCVYPVVAVPLGLPITQTMPIQLAQIWALLQYRGSHTIQKSGSCFTPMWAKCVCALASF